ncbi:MAG: acylphosphatase [Candidatus Bathyarchaeaceae archaeon]
MSEKAYEVKVSGRFQRIGYRRFILENAQELGLSGYVRNIADGSVAIFVQGEEKQVKQFLDKIKEAPPPVVVKSFEVKAADPNPEVKFFNVEFGSVAEELQEGFGSMEKEFRDYRQEFRDFAERTDKNFETLAQRYGEISEKLTQVLETLQRESAETRRELTRAVDALTELIKQFIAQRRSG